MKFYALKISEGDSFVLQTKDEKNYLIDTGKSDCECLHELRELAICRIDAVFITHFDADHFDGLESVVNSSIDVREVWLPDCFARIRKTLRGEASRFLKTLLNEVDTTNAPCLCWCSSPTKHPHPHLRSINVRPDLCLPINVYEEIPTPVSAIIK